ncbi:MAG TPA: ADP-ribosylation factor-like protein [Candidatus Nanopelagicaceae bacterium]|nr:ADP-ribosylation factor-like protein [Candidatus Nanopelagicaceae bacterium]
MGLDFAGKTSIITVISKKFGFEEDILKLMPTRKIARDAFKFLGIEFIRMDFGGQLQYREEYLKNPTKYISGTDLLFYVIDAQDYDRYVETIDYLDKILLFLKENQEYPPLCVLFHKFDPQLTKEKVINQRILTIKHALIRYSNDFDIFFFETSIYDIKSIMDAFSSGLSLLFEKMEMVSRLFSRISKNYNSIMIALFDAKGITIGEYYRPHLHLSEKIRIYDKYLEAQKKIIAENRTLLEFSDKFEDGSRYSGLVETLKFGNLDFYLLFIIEEYKEDLEKTVDVLNKLESAKAQMETLILQLIQ